jgi:enterochelin esterase-like enzyme
VALGGGSFAGVSALEGGLAYPEVFGAVLAESPSLWIAEGAVLQVSGGGGGVLAVGGAWGW